MKRKNIWARRAVGMAAAALLTAGLLTACGSPQAEEGKTEEETVQAGESGGETEHSAETEAEEDFFSTMQKFSSGELQALPFEELSESEEQYGVVLLSEEEESGLTLYGYLEPERLYEGVYIIDEKNVVNAFPSIVYLTEAGLPPTMQWEEEEKLLEITVYGGEGDQTSGTVYTFKRQDSGLLVSMDEDDGE